MKTPTSLIANLAQFTLLTATLALLVSNPAYAQFTKANTVLTLVKTTLMSVGGLICACALIWGGYTFMFQRGKWAEISNIVLGAMLVGGATELSGLLMS